MTKRDVEADMMHSGSCDLRAKAETLPSLQSDRLHSRVWAGLDVATTLGISALVFSVHTDAELNDR